jgi:hypothetical protein
MMIVRLIQDLSYLRQRKSQLPRLTGKPKPSKILGIELLVVVVRVTGRFEQVLAGVKPDRTHLSTANSKPIKNRVKPVSNSQVKGFLEEGKSKDGYQSRERRNVPQVLH